eukprot:2130670-Alexandrium_andersonii.AAC.1
MLEKGLIEGGRSEIILVPVPVGATVVYKCPAALFDAHAADPTKEVSVVLEAERPFQVFYVVGGATMIEGFYWAHIRSPTNAFIIAALKSGVQCATWLDDRCPAD